MQSTVYTIGHSTRAADEFFQILDTYGIEMLVDVRRFPQSRRNPQYNQAELRDGLLSHGIGYLHLEGLGGRRSVTEPTLNAGWENASFRGYADYMQTTAFTAHLEQLAQISSEKKTAILCAEAVPWRCHRALIADALLLRGFEVVDILSEKDSRPHQMTPWARVQGGQITYPKD